MTHLSLTHPADSFVFVCKVDPHRVLTLPLFRYAHGHYTAVPPLPELIGTSPPSSSAVDSLPVDAWALSALQSLKISSSARGTGTPLAIPIDGDADPSTCVSSASPDQSSHRPPSRRDSQRHREALKGKEGSRQRRRWDNDHLVGVPNAQPPHPADWEARRTHPVHQVPYHLAQLWDCGLRQRVEHKMIALKAARKAHQRSTGSATGISQGKVPRDLRESAKRTPAVRALVRALEEPVCRYLDAARRHSTCLPGHDHGHSHEDALFDDGITPNTERGPHCPASHHMACCEGQHLNIDAGVVFDSLGDGEAAAFKCDLTFLLPL